MELLPLYAALLAMLVDLFVLLRPWFARNPVVPDWPWQVIAYILFTVVTIIVFLGIGPVLQEHRWVMAFVALVLILAAHALLIYTFAGWRRVRDIGGNIATVLVNLERHERNIHISSVLIAFIGIIADILYKVNQHHP